MGQLALPSDVVSDTFINKQEDRSAALYRLMAVLAEKGASPPEVYRIALHSANQKFDTPQRLWEDVLRTVVKIAPKAGAYDVQHASALTDVDETLNWVANPLLYDDAVGTVVGEPSARKSWFILHMGVAIACPTITDILGFPIEIHGPVLHFDLDDRRPRRLKRRLGNILAYYRDGDRTFDIPFYFVSGDFNYTDQRWKERLRASLKTIQDKEGKPVVMTVVDTLHRAGFNPKDWGANAQPFLDGLSDMAIELRTAFVIVHHTAKRVETQNRNIRNAPWGSTFTGASLDPTWSLSRNYAEDDDDDSVHHINLEVVSKEGPEPPPWILSFGKNPDAYEVDIQEAPMPERVLAALRRVSEPCTQAELARRLGVKDEIVKRAVSRLQAKAKVDVRQSGSAKLISLPEGGPSEF
jgi:RecA-family ATPase